MMVMFFGDTYLGGDDHIDSCGVVDNDSELNEHIHHHEDVDDDSELPKNIIMEKEDPSRLAFVDAAASWIRDKLVLNIVNNIKNKITLQKIIMIMYIILLQF